VQYRAATGEQYEDEYVIDLSEIRGMVRIGSPPLLDIAKHTDSISKAIAGLLAGNRRIKTDIYTSEDRTTESAEHKAWLEEERRKQQEAGEPDS
jgi:hypothetical protein